MKLTTVISAIGYVLLFFPPAGASEKQPVDVKEKKASEETEAAIRRYAARIAVAKIALEHGSGKQARIELSLTNPECAVADAPATRTCVAVALSPDGRQVASAAIAYSPDGKRIVTGDWSQRLRFWDAQTGVQLLALDKQKRVINTIAFSPDGKKIAAGGWDVQATICDSTLDKNSEGPP